jgi:GNAT superfamily N-acetyltransferase
MIVPVHCRGSVRTPGPDDATALIAMFERCSPQTRYERFLSPVPAFPARHLADIVHPRRGRWSWVTADDDASRIVAVASLFCVGRDTAEVGLLVEDDEQRRGLGTELLRVAAEHAREVGIRTIVAETLGTSHHVRRMLERWGDVTVRPSGHTSALTLDLVDQVSVVASSW